MNPECPYILGGMSMLQKHMLELHFTRLVGLRDHIAASGDGVRKGHDS